MIVGKAAILDPIDDPGQQLCRENKQQREAKCKDGSCMCEPGTDRNPAIKPRINPPIILPQRLSHTTKTASNDPIKNVGNKRHREPDDEPGTRVQHTMLRLAIKGNPEQHRTKQEADGDQCGRNKTNSFV